MRTLIILLFTSSILLGQENTNTTQESQNQTSDFEILSSCGILGVDSEEFDYFKKLITNKNYSEISNNLKSANILNQLISVIVLEELTNRKLVKLVKEESDAISKIKTLNKNYYLCTGCTKQSIGSISSIFNADISNPGAIDIIRMIKNNVGLYN